MGVYIKDMTLDEFSEYGDYCQTLIGTGQAEEVPPHGRLIDADALIDYCKHFAEVFKGSSLPTDKARRDELLGVIGEIVNAPTIIPAEECE